MNNLQLALAVLGAVVLAAVVAHGAWTSRKSRPKQADLEPDAGSVASIEPAVDDGGLDERRCHGR